MDGLKGGRGAESSKMQHLWQESRDKGMELMVWMAINMDYKGFVL